jgi:thymidylate synthase ThyX
MTNTNKISARIVADSITKDGKRITSIVAVIPRIVLAELNTHRALSKNSASSRAIPFPKMCDMVVNEPFIPMLFQKTHKGMQGTEQFTEVSDIAQCVNMWLDARDKAVASAKELDNFGVTKQLCNRILEPFMYHTVLLTATEWQNFIALRAHKDAEVHIQDFAYKVIDVLNASTPRLLMEGEWHIPFGDNILISGLEGLEANTTKTIKIATARCARVSYNNFEGKDDYEADIKLHDQLLESGHMSPFEHCAQAASGDTISGNFVGYVQYRKMFSGENRADSRLTIKN